MIRRVLAISLFCQPLIYLALFAGSNQLYREIISPSLQSHLSASSITNDIPIWVLFRDRGLAPYELHESIQKVRASIDPRALRRRQKTLPDSLVVGEWDVPVAEQYVDAIRQRSLELRTVSRWLNGVSAVVSSDLLLKIATLPFVERIQPVGRGQANIAPYIEGESWARGAHPQSGTMGGGDYGNSYEQTAQIHVIEAHRAGYTGQGVLIAMLDTGYQLDHEAFEHLSVVDAYDFIYQDDDPSYNPNQDLRRQPRHGTATTSVIGGYAPGELIGLAHQADFLLAKTEDNWSETPIEEDYWVQGLEWAEGYGADVVSSSLGYKNWYETGDYDGWTSPCSRASNLAFELGMIICNSAGNEGPMPMTLGAPADAEGVVSVGAVDSSGMLARFSSRGPTADGRIKPDVAARGVRTTCVEPYSENRYGRWGGTSLACPLVAGGVALVIEAHPDWPPWRVVEAIKETATQADRPNNDYGWGIINVWAAIRYPSLSGWILDEESGMGIPGAQMYFESEDSSGVFPSDSSGFFDAVNLPDGHYKLRATAPGYSESMWREFRIPPDMEVDFALRKTY